VRRHTISFAKLGAPKIPEGAPKIPEGAPKIPESHRGLLPFEPGRVLRRQSHGRMHGLGARLVIVPSFANRFAKPS
jgi:hypothetical protein